MTRPRRLTRWLAWLCVAFSLAIAALWMTLVFAPDALSLDVGPDPVHFYVWRIELGSLDLELVSAGDPTIAVGKRGAFGIVLHAGGRCGFAQRGPGQLLLLIPLWLPSLLLALVGFWLLRRSRPRRSPRGCPTCGYDLRGTRVAGIDRCPECGMPIGSAPGQARKTCS